MDYEQFFEKLVTELSEARPGVNFSETEVKKLQGESYIGISVTPEGSNMGASMNVQPLFEQYQDGKPYELIFDRVLAMADKALEDMPAIDPNSLLDYEAMRKTLILQVIPVQGNEEMLSGIPHQTMEDMAVVVRFQIQHNDNGQATILVNNQMLETFGIGEDMLMQDAMMIAPERNPMRLENMGKIMAELSGGIFGAPEDSPMWVATVESQVCGACVLAYPDFMDQASELMGGDFYVLPSSIHEVIIIPDDGSHEAKVLSDMVRTINETEVAPADRLSDNAYHYDAMNRIFEKAEAFEDRMNGIEQPEAEEQNRPKKKDRGDAR